MVNMALGQLFLIWPFADTKSGMVQESPSRSMDKVIVRLPDGMRDRIKAAAERNNRSMNAEIVATLEEKYPAPAIDRAVLGWAIVGLLNMPEGPERDAAIANLNSKLADAGMTMRVKPDEGGKLLIDGTGDSG